LKINAEAWEIRQSPPGNERRDSFGEGWAREPLVLLFAGG
jgi:hypothetical protein